MRFVFTPSPLKRPAVDLPATATHGSFELAKWQLEHVRYTAALNLSVATLGIFSGESSSTCVFQGSFRPNTCCGILELKTMGFYATDVNQKEFSKTFQEGLAHVAETLKKGFVHLTLHKYPSDNNWYQHPYFVRTLEEYPGAIHSAERKNPNSGNILQFWVLPI